MFLMTGKIHLSKYMTLPGGAPIGVKTGRKSGSTTDDGGSLTSLLIIGRQASLAKNDRRFIADRTTRRPSLTGPHLPSATRGHDYDNRRTT